MNSLLKTELIRAYHASGKNKAAFIKLAIANTGLTKAGLKRGTVGEFVETLIFHS